MTLIDLGELRDEAFDGDQTPRRPAPIGRPVRVGLLLLLLLGTLAGAAPPVEHTPAAVVPARLGSEVFVTGGRLYVVDPVSPVSVVDRPYLTAYTLPGAKQLWRMPLAAAMTSRGQVQGVSAHGGRLLLTVSPAGGGIGETFAIAEEDGRTLWHQPGEAIPTEKGGLLLRSATPTDDPVPRPGPVDWSSEMLHAVDPTTGTVRWSRTVADVELSFAFNRRAAVRRLVTVSVAGRVEVLDPDSGALLGSTDLRPVNPAASFRSTQVVGDLLLVGNGLRTDAYGLDRLDLRWERNSTGSEPAMHGTDCGESICLFRARGGMEVLDRATGRVRWQTDERFVLRQVDGRLLIVGEVRLGTRQPFMVLDALDGRLLAELGSWELARFSTWDDPTIGVRPRSDDRLLVARIDLADGQAHVLHVLRDVSGHCQVGGQALICRRMDATLGVWPLDR